MEMDGKRPNFQENSLLVLGMCKFYWKMCQKHRDFGGFSFPSNAERTAENNNSISFMGIMSFLAKNPYKSSFMTVTGWGVDPIVAMLAGVFSSFISSITSTVSSLRTYRQEQQKKQSQLLRFFNERRGVGMEFFHPWNSEFTPGIFTRGKGDWYWKIQRF